MGEEESSHKKIRMNIDDETAEKIETVQNIILDSQNQLFKTEYEDIQDIFANNESQFTKLKEKLVLHETFREEMRKLKFLLKSVNETNK